MTIPASDVIFTPPGAPTQQPTVQDRLAQSVSLKDFGAVGDGVTDDTAAIQAAVDYCMQNGFDLIVPVGNYVIGSPGIQIVGTAGQFKLGLVVRGSNSPDGGGSQFVAPSASVNLFTLSYAGSIAFYNIAFVNGNHQIHCPTFVADLKFEECIFGASKYTGIGFYADGDAERVYFIRCLFQFGQYGFYHSALNTPNGFLANFDQSHIFECEFRGQQFNAIYSAQVVGGFNTVRDCHFTNIGQHTINFEVPVGQSANIANWVFDNLTTEDAAGWLKNSYPVTGGSTVAATTTMTVIDPLGFYVGSVVSVFQGDPNNPLIAKITSISGNTFTLDTAATATIDNIDVVSVKPTGSISSGMNTLTVDHPDLLFQGDRVQVDGAGADGSNLVATITTPPGGNVVTLDTSASTNVTNVIVTKLAFPTTGSISGTPSSPSNVLTVQSTSGIMIGDVLTIQGGAKGPQDFERGEDLYSEVTAIDRVNKVITLDSPAFGTISDTEVTRARYDFIHHNPQGSSTTNLYINCVDGYNAPATIGRYSIFNEGKGTVLNGAFRRPIYNSYVNMIGGTSPWRRSALHWPYGLLGASMGPDTIADPPNGNFITSPRGRNLSVSMLGSNAVDGSGTFGSFSVVQATTDGLITQLEIDASGNVGVGRAPTAKFDVFQNVATKYTVSVLANGASDGSGAFHQYDNPTRSFWAGLFGTSSGLGSDSWAVYDATWGQYSLVVSGGTYYVRAGTWKPRTSANETLSTDQFMVNDGTIQGLMGGYGDSGLVLGSFTNHSILFRTHNANRMFLDTNGNLGIGRAPTAKFDAFQNAAATHTVSVLANGASDGYGALHHYDNPTRSFWTGIFGTASGLGSDSWAVYDATWGQYSLVVSGGSHYVRAGTWKPRTSANETLSTDQFMVNDGTIQGLMGGYGDSGLVLGSFTNHSILFRTHNANRMFLDTNGNLGVGATPQTDTKLLVSSSNSGVPNLGNPNGIGPQAGLVVESLGQTGLQIAVGDIQQGNIFFSSPSNTNTASIYSQYNGGSPFLAFTTNGSTERVRIDASGNVGIGGVAAGGGYHVESIETRANNNSLLRVRNDGSGGQAFVATKNTVREYWSGALGAAGGFVSGAYAIYDATAAATRLLIDNSGNVGIGAAPAGPIHIANYGNNSSLRINHSTGSSGNAGGWHLSAYYTSVEMGYIDVELIDGTPSAEKSVLRFGTISNGTLAERARIDSSGNLLLSTTTANGTLTINTAVPTYEIYLNGSAPGNIACNTGQDFYLQQLSNAALILQTNSADRIRIDASGNIGVGVSPTAPVHIANYGNNSSFRVNHSTGSSGGAGGWHLSSHYGTVEIGYIDSELTYGGSGAEASVLRFGTIGGGTLAERMRVDASGNVGIGTVAPAYALDVNGYVHANNVSVPSDVRFKSNVAPIKDGLAKVLAMRGVTFEWKKGHRAYEQSLGADGAPQRQIGVIAQEIEKLFPELVTKAQTCAKNADGSDETVTDARAVDYGRMVAVLIEAVKELAAKVETLQAQVSANP